MKRIPDAKIHYASAGAVRRHRPADPARPTGIAPLPFSFAHSPKT